MRKLILILLLLAIPALLHAQTHGGESQQPNNLSQGSEKAAHEVAHPGEAHGGEGEAPKSYFGIPAWILKLANMLLFLGVLVYLTAGPVKKSFAERGQQIRKAADEARARREKADRLASDIQERLDSIEAEVRAIHERAEAEGERQKRELIAAAEAEATKILAAARAEVDSRLKHARHELTEYAGQLASARAETILRETITGADQQKLFRESLREIEEVRS
jgi:F-type H+-transporting ATPase subunit b